MTELTNKDMVKLLRKKMLENDWNQKELARDIGISSSYICDVFKERRDCTARIAEYLGFQKLTVFRPFNK